MQKKMCSKQFTLASHSSIILVPIVTVDKGTVQAFTQATFNACAGNIVYWASTGTILSIGKRHCICFMKKNSNDDKAKLYHQILKISNNTIAQSQISWNNREHFVLITLN